MKRLLVSGTRVVFHTTVGVVLLVAGVVMLVTPGPGIVTVAVGLAVLAREYDWAERLKRSSLHHVRDASTRARARLAARRASRTGVVDAVEDLPTMARDTAPPPTVEPADPVDPVDPADAVDPAGEVRSAGSA